MKAILTLKEMPNNCKECQLEDETIYRREYVCCGTPDFRKICNTDQEKDEDGKPEWCPLRGVPGYMDPITAKDVKNLKKLNINVNYEEGYTTGWNACLQEIGGGEIMDEGLISKLIWIMNTETSTYKQGILKQAIEVLENQEEKEAENDKAKGD